MDLEQIKDLITPDLIRVEELITDALGSESKPVNDLVKHVSHFAGKRLRPALVLLVAKALGKVNEDHVKLGAVIELIHTATLVHDDILDGAAMRRRVESVNFLHGNHVSVLLGDMIYARAFRLSLDLSDTRGAEYLASITQTICQGEIEQIFHRNDFELARDQYFSVIGAKTASLYKTSCELAALYSGSDQRTASSLGSFGYDLGLAFQIVDDCLDIVGDEKEVGKSLGTDLEKGKMTLPLIHLAATLSGADRERLKEIFLSTEGEDKSRAIADLFDLKGAVDYSFSVAEEYIESSLAVLEILPDSPSREAMISAAQFVLIRRL